MRLHLITVGEPKLAYARAGWDEYEKRLRRYHKVQVTRVGGRTGAQASEAIARAAGRAPLILLDPRGEQFTSESLSAYLDAQALDGRGELAFAVGGPEGHTDDLRARAHRLWSLSLLTLPHDLAMILLLEALYRAATISAGEPYHRGST
ncbi:23S rRNA (pseudouridine-1915-N(3)-) methyltransferase [Deinococcus geothermalis DSM 11300]|uniref:Ribosomal RNA large subunit methyltransferase H n=1 Tax=Deinococcus geothermalis (strain DSM 11300 / CIP 105573 / AG-3a) TaxID=319795 RepID=RLMH_DEIGD|nr:23S rRNA (pseudouridine(1915)-N(3))-methyltransferase RlmH [Deinococcus geothermalis]Q1IXU8.1 RecName: Full=Ribosomal RNA large subunit methyltransferase H; AltName: Full=23S rRNA (pseudouridine1915-N3)-methyltransferase; AltName: Full=23S rRNA m3Psi1915 methyltransferase; AltName: Full=rRNA (pseudouridine-N3-)-methyltransferase RlmH [Deinococcus geothermalis DSM 11300]ABF45936.1 23S rRNA (pseudouridine-1915-N(3)-) methyltransferase [Deinococcus geothermalis DSM 11300]